MYEKFIATLEFPNATQYDPVDIRDTSPTTPAMYSQHYRCSRVIDVHHHYFPPDLDKAKANEMAWWRAPSGTLPWSAENCISTMDSSGIDVAILSLPAVPTMSTGVGSHSMVRQHNLAMKSLCLEYPRRFGFFATLPCFHDVEGALDEIAYALDVLHADGIAIASSYGIGSEARYIGDDLYEPIWSELDKRAAVVFVHGAQTPSSTPCPSALLGLPITEVPNETYKAAAHLVVSGRKRRHPNIKIILAHAGGSTVALAARVAILSAHMGCELTADQILEDFRSFYYETALSAYEPTLSALEAFALPDRTLFGTDFPAVNAQMAGWYTHNLSKYYANNSERLSTIMSTNALQLFPRFREDTEYGRI
ncbi:hypothetical protein AX15_007625 [Amanita polypyramis BW_CC]|nr:hypothetical protein AX15_007625 [Amanita polypyramis BW_CC]